MNATQQLDDSIVPAGSDGVTYEGARENDGEVSATFMRNYSWWKIAELVLVIAAIVLAGVALFRTDHGRVHHPITQLRIRNIGDNAKLEPERLALKDVPVVYWFILASFIKLWFTIIQLPAVGPNIMQHVWTNRPKATQTEAEAFKQWPVDQLGLFENAVFWPFLFTALAALLGVSDWQWLVILWTFAFTFSLLVSVILVYRFTDIDIYPFAFAAVLITFSLVWALIDTHRAAHETDYPAGFFVYNWVSLILTIGFVIIVIGTRQASWSAKILMIYIVLFHHICLFTGIIACFVVGQRNL